MMARKLEPESRSIIYGWPTVVVKDFDRSSRVSPLFAIQIEPNKGPGPEWKLHAATEPEFNLGEC